ncbi:hypothetical protein CEXT_197471 [Caerostris extrusa]|uniref:Uncharacterized protein n=1 Tax=Caerostris extrusa TaxID=172846 RepID=A0AAV4VMM6_CAEEX|nr:hypothetical protein CEXT_197471 [Caerostris extrusa]
MHISFYINTRFHFAKRLFELRAELNCPKPAGRRSLFRVLSRKLMESRTKPRRVSKWELVRGVHWELTFDDRSLGEIGHSQMGIGHWSISLQRDCRLAKKIELPPI